MGIIDVINHAKQQLDLLPCKDCAYRKLFKGEKPFIETYKIEIINRLFAKIKINSKRVCNYTIISNKNLIKIIENMKEDKL